jgi:hypothetical protein
MLRRIARTRYILAAVASAILCGASGCAEWISNLSSAEAWEKMSPSNIWYNMQPHRLERWNQGEGLPADVYYSVSDDVASEPANKATNPASHPDALVGRGFD